MNIYQSNSSGKKKTNGPLTAEEALAVFQEWQEDSQTKSLTCSHVKHPDLTDLPELTGVITEEGFRMECPKCGYQRILLPTHLVQRAIDKREGS